MKCEWDMACCWYACDFAFSRTWETINDLITEVKFESNSVDPIEMMGFMGVIIVEIINDLRGRDGVNCVANTIDATIA